MSVVDDVLHRPEFADAPPVLVDVGASGGVHEDWSPIAPHAVCIAFDADDREMGTVEKQSSGFKRLLVVRAILHDQERETAPFYLTRSPYCSSTLPPDQDALAAWAFHELFEVVGEKPIRTVTLARVLAEQRLDRVDWFKSDSQGMDLRLFRSLGSERMPRVMAAQFEPGIIDAYRGEDTLEDVLGFMRREGFWVSDLALHGSQRIGPAARAELPPALRGRARRAVRSSPGWGEITYLNRFEGGWSVRDLLLGWVIATVRRQHGFALELALKGHGEFGDPMFEVLRRESLGAMRRRAFVHPVIAALGRLRSMLDRWI